MAPLRQYTNWNKRDYDKEEKIEPYRKYYFICEGQNTEKYYFKRLIDLRKQLNISPFIDIIFLEKTGKDIGSSNPKSLIALADDFIKKNKNKFDVNFDKIILVFDLDIYENDNEEFQKIIYDTRKKGYMLAVTNPSFELFLLLHKENSLIDIIIPNEQKIVKNEWVGKNKNRKRFINDLFYKTFNFDPKSSDKVKAFVEDVAIAISQEQRINNDYTNSHNRLTSNIGKTIEKIKSNI